MVDAPAESLPALTWTDWPARRQPVRSAAVALVIALTALAIGIVDGWLAVVAVVVLLWATADVLLPATWTVDDRGVTVVRAMVPRRHGWARFAGWRSTAEGFVLVGRGHRAALVRGRTLLLRCAGVRESVKTALASVLPESR